MNQTTFEHVETWVFDLDNTIYPARFNLFDVPAHEFASRQQSTRKAELKRILGR